MIRTAGLSLALALCATTALANPPITYSPGLRPEIMGSETYDGLDAPAMVIDAGNPTPNSIATWTDEAYFGAQGKGGVTFTAEVSFQGYIAPASGSTSTLTVTKSPQNIAVGASLFGAGIPAGTVVTAGSGPTWTVNGSLTIGTPSSPVNINSVPSPSVEPVYIPNVGVQVLAASQLSQGLDYGARSRDRGFSALIYMDCAAGSDATKSIVYAKNGSSGAVDVRQPAFFVNTTANSDSNVAAPACTLEFQYRNPTGFNPITSQVLQSGPHWYSVQEWNDDSSNMHLLVNGVQTDATGNGFLPYPGTINPAEPTILGAPGYGQPSIINWMGLFAETNAEGNAALACKQDWWLRQRLVAIKAARPDLVPNGEAALTAGPACAAYASATPTVDPASVEIAAHTGSTQTADAYGHDTSGHGSALPALGARHLAWNFKPSGNVNADVRPDYTVGYTPGAGSNYFSPVYSSTQSPTPQSNMQLIAVGTQSLGPSPQCTEPTDPQSGSPFLRMGSLNTGGVFSGGNTAPGGQGYIWNECGIASVNIAGQGYVLPYGGRATLTFRENAVDGSYGYTCGSACPSYTGSSYSNFNWADFELYSVNGILTKFDSHRVEVDSNETYPGTQTNSYSGMSATDYTHGTGTYLGPNAAAQPLWGENVAGSPDDFGSQATWRDTANPGQIEPWKSSDRATGVDTATGLTEDFFSLTYGQLGPIHTMTFDENVATNQLCEYLDGFETVCITMPPEMKASPTFILSATYPNKNGSGSAEGPGALYSYDIMSIQAWNPN